MNIEKKIKLFRIKLKIPQRILQKLVARKLKNLLKIAISRKSAIYYFVGYVLKHLITGIQKPNFCWFNNFKDKQIKFPTAIGKLEIVFRPFHFCALHCAIQGHVVSLFSFSVLETHRADQQN